MSVRLWVDDVREPPSKDWLWVKDYDAAITVLKHVKVTYLSVDHDLGLNPDGTEAKSGYEIMKWIEEEVARKGSRAFNTVIFTTHSMNPVGAGNIRRAISRIRLHIAEMMSYNHH